MKKTRPIQPGTERERKINAFIPEAERIARKACPHGSFAKRSKDADRYSREFHLAMNRLCIKAGLRVA